MILFFMYVDPTTSVQAAFNDQTIIELNQINSVIIDAHHIKHINQFNIVFDGINHINQFDVDVIAASI